tara:strand:+ start:285 stop:485 length:201 start_codon:yes stop_codon:yes gene_type:complete
MKSKYNVDNIIKIEFIWCKDAYTIFTPDKIVKTPSITCKNKLIPIIKIGFRKILFESLKTIINKYV